MRVSIWTHILNCRPLTLVVVISFLPEPRSTKTRWSILKQNSHRSKNKIPIETSKHQWMGVVIDDEKKNDLAGQLVMHVTSVGSFFSRRKVTDSEWKSIIKRWKTTMNAHLVHRSGHKICQRISPEFFWLTDDTEAELKLKLLLIAVWYSIFFESACSSHTTSEYSLHFSFSDESLFQFCFQMRELTSCGQLHTKILFWPLPPHPCLDMLLLTHSLAF